MVEPYLRQQALAHLALDQAADPVLEQAGIRLWRNRHGCSSPCAVMVPTRGSRVR